MCLTRPVCSDATAGNDAPTPVPNCWETRQAQITLRRRIQSLLLCQLISACLRGVARGGQEAREDHLCGKLMLSMCGTRDAASNWHAAYTKTLIDAGFIQGVANPCLYRKGESSLLVHGDDFAAAGPEEKLQEVKEILENEYKIKTEVLGGGPNDSVEIRFLNRVVRWDAKFGLKLEADPRHAEAVIRELGIEDAKSTATPECKAVVKKEEEADDAEEELGPSEAKAYRACAARLDYLARPVQ